jgi:hypothetical protein
VAARPATKILACRRASWSQSAACGSGWASIAPVFTVLDGEIELTFRGVSAVATAGETINVPANAPHVFRNVSEGSARLLCLCSPAGQEEFFKEVGVPVAHRTEAPPALDDAATGAFIAKDGGHPVPADVTTSSGSLGGIPVVNVRGRGR